VLKRWEFVSSNWSSFFASEFSLCGWWHWRTNCTLTRNSLAWPRPMSLTYTEEDLHTPRFPVKHETAVSEGRRHDSCSLAWNLTSHFTGRTWTEGNGENCITRNFIIRTRHKIFIRVIQSRTIRQVVHNVYSVEMHTEFWSVNLKGRCHWGDLGADVRYY
jgi:hypothetical protein